MRLTSPPLSYIPLLPILSGVVAGVLFGRYVSTDFSLWAGLMAMAGIGAVAMRRSVVAEVFLSMALGCVAVSMSVPREFTALPDRECVMEGVVTEVSLTGDRQSAGVSVDDRYGDFKARITYPVFIPRLEVGDRIRFSGTYSLPRRDTDLPLEDDMSEYYFREGISILCYVPQNCLEVTGRSGNPVLSLRRMRSGIVDRIYSSGLNEPTAIFLVAVLTGDTSALTPALRENYSAAGVAHILALSGAHIAIIAVAVSIVLFPLLFVGRRKLRWWLTIAVLWGYALFTGMSPSVCRSVIMASAVLLALIFDRPRSSLNALCLAALLILLFSPMSLFNAGFQLSFAATLCIILFTPRFMPQSARKTYRYKVWGIVAVTLAATLGTMPLVAWHFHSIPIFFFPANIVAVAVMPVMVAGGLLLTLLLSLGVNPGWLIATLDFVYGIFDAVVDFVASLPKSTLRGLYFDGWLLIPMYAALAFGGIYLYVRRLNYAVLAIATLLFTVGVYAAMRPRYADGDAYVLRSQPFTSIVVHHGDMMSVMTLSPSHRFSHDSLVIADRYRDYISTRGIQKIEMMALDSVASMHGGILPYGRQGMRVAHLSDGERVSCNTVRRCDYCLVTAKWYGNPVTLYHSVEADTIVLSTDINRRRRERYFRELKSAGIPVIDLGTQALASIPVGW